MNIRQAFLKAADTIEAEHSCYQFYATDVEQCGTPMCMWGWVGYHLGMIGKDVWYVANSIGKECSSLYTLGFESKFKNFETSAASAAGLLRLYADKHFPAEAPAAA